MDNAQRWIIRPATEADLADITNIYAHHVLHGTGTFELDPPSVQDMRQRFQEVSHRQLPWLVAVQSGPQGEGPALGFAYANYFRPRLAYRYCAEDSIYLAPTAMGLGLGKCLLAELITQCQRRGVRQMVALIGDSANHASVALHRGQGFEPMGVMKSAGWKFDAWRDVVFMQKSLGEGDACAPAPAPAQAPA